MKVSYTVDVQEFLHKLLQYIQPLTGTISPVEEAVLFEFLSLPFERFRYNRFSTLGRRKVFAALNLSRKMTIPNINNRIYDLCKKKVIIRDEDSILQITPTISKPFEAFQRSNTFNLHIQFENKDNPPNSGTNT